MPSKGYVFFDSSPVFTRIPGSTVKAGEVAWFDGKEPLYSGWRAAAIDGGELATEAAIGQGQVVLIGFEATFRSTPHARSSSSLTACITAAPCRRSCKDVQLLESHSGRRLRTQAAFFV